MASPKVLKRPAQQEQGTNDEAQRGTNGWYLKDQYKKWLRDTPEGQDEAEAIQRRLAALKETWERKGI